MKRVSRPLFLVALLGLILGQIACLQSKGPSGQEAPKLSATYHAVLLDNGQVYYGKLEGLGTDFPVLTDVYYIQNQVNPETKEVKNVLVRRGKELHGPDRMILAARHIVLIEPVGSDSKVAQLIQDSKKQ